MIKTLDGVVFDADKIKQMRDTFEAQIKLANSTDEEDRKKTDLFWENTFVRRLLDGTGNYSTGKDFFKVPISTKSKQYRV